MKRGMLLLLAGALWSPGAQAQEDAAKEVVDAEHAFAVKARAAGVKAAFLEYLAPDAIIFRPGPVKAHDVLPAQPARPTLLRWRPALAGLSRAGDLGYSTGPSAGHAAPDQPVAWTGYYVTVWQRQADGSLRAVIDHGCVTQSPSDMSEPLHYLPAGAASAPGDAAQALAQLRALDAGSAPAHGKVRTYAGGALHGGAAARALLFREAAPQLESLGGGVAKSGDVGYTYGAYGWREERGHYVRIWRRGEAGWEVVVDLFAADR